MNGEREKCMNCQKGCLDCHCNKDKTLREALQNTSNLIKWLYFDYMLTVEGANLQTFKRVYLDCIEEFMDIIHDKYCDHVEGQRS